MPRRRITATIVAAMIIGMAASVSADDNPRLKYTRKEIEARWQNRIQTFLDRGIIPLIDFQSYLPQENGDRVLSWTTRMMDEKGVALMSLSGYWSVKGNKKGSYGWGYYIHEVVNRHPDYFILSTNKGGNYNWWARRGGRPTDFIDQLERQVQSAVYPFIGEIEFRHYPSNAQCRAGKTHRDLDIPLNGQNGHRVFRLSSETGVPFSVHLEPEDQPLEALEEMLKAYPKARIIVAHFGQIRHPERLKRFGPALVSRLLATYPNLYFDLSAGEAGRRYLCGSQPFDNVIWKLDRRGRQKKALKPAYKNILTKFSPQFVTGFDYGAANRQSEKYLKRRIANIRLILRELPKSAKHDIAYRTGWKLLTGRSWKKRGN